MPNVELAEDLWTRGAGHVLGAQALVEVATADARERNPDNVDQVAFNGRYSASIHLLIGFAFELLLKAAFLLNGGDPKELREISHDLVLALDKAEEHGFASNVEHLRWIVEHVRDPHHKHQFRYGGPETIEMPGLEATIPALEKLAREVGASLQSS